MKKNNIGFTLIELLVVISIIGVLVGVSIFGLSGARESSRDARRKSDLEFIRSGLELYKADCNRYPPSLPAAGTALVGNPAYGASCLATNTYISAMPFDPISGSRSYVYQVSGNGYNLCSSLEQQNLPSINCGSTCGTACNYKITNP